MGRSHESQHRETKFRAFQQSHGNSNSSRVLKYGEYKDGYSGMVPREIRTFAEFSEVRVPRPEDGGYRLNSTRHTSDKTSILILWRSATLFNLCFTADEVII